MARCLAVGVVSSSLLLIVCKFVNVSSFQLGNPKAFTRSPSRSLATSVAGSTTHDDEIYVVSWEGCVANTVDWRIQTGLKVAASVWPEVDEALNWEDKTWLENKLSALSSVPCHTNDGVSVSCEYALATRLLLEEQELDEGRSNGKRGKYASKFHPQQQTTESSSNGNGSRPLTVGEISANWRDGGMLRETLQIKYHCNYKDPIPILQTKVEELVDSGEYSCPSTVENIEEVLSSCRGKLVVTVSDVSDLPVAEETMASLSLPFETVNDVEEALRLQKNCAALIVQPTTETAQKLLQCAPSGSTTFWIESSWPTLERYVSLHGDNIPRGKGNIGKSFLPDRRVSLSLASWARNSDPTHQAAATMNPWTGVVGFIEFSELLSARIVRK